MLILKELKLKNFLSHNDTTIAFKPNQKLLIDGRSGAGKSAIVDAIVWALYGEGRADTRSLISHGAKSMEVWVTMVDDKTGVCYRVEREATKAGKTSLTVGKQTKVGNFLPLGANGVRGYQTLLEKTILNSSYLLFINSIAYPQDNVENFVKQTAARRKEIILEIAHAADYDEYYTRTKEKIDEIERTLSVENTKVELLRNSVEADSKISANIAELISTEQVIRMTLEESEKKLENLNNEITKFGMIAGELDGKINRIRAIKIKMGELTDSIVSMQAEMDKLDEKEILKLTAETNSIPQLKSQLQTISDIELKAGEWKTKMMEALRLKPLEWDYERDIKTINEQLIEVMARKLLVCPDTQRECTYFAKDRNEQVERLSKMLQTKQDLLVDQKVKMAEFNNAVAALGECPAVDIQMKSLLQTQMDAAERKKEQLTLLVANRQNAIAQLTANIEANKREITSLNVEHTELEKEIDNLNLKLLEKQNVERERTAVSSEINLRLKPSYESAFVNLKLAQSALERIEVNKKVIEETGEQFAKMKTDLNNLSLLKEAFGNSGIKAIVVDYLIPRLEDRINDILSKLSEFRIHLETQKSTVSGESIVEGLFITIFNEHGLEFDFSNYSGGERLKIIVAISEALAEIQNVGFRILDELWVGLDQESTEKFVEVMEILQERFAQLVCISHLPSIKDTFSDRIEVVKINGSSKIT